jgi:cytoskeletal protein RodZ
MPSVGEYLREGRDALGVSLEEISARTCISVRQLDALETNRLERLPGGLVNISFARQYARELHLDEDEAAALIKEAMGIASQAQTRMPAGRARVASDGPASKLAEWASEFFRKHGGSVASLIIGATLIGGGFYSFRFLEEPTEERQAVPAVVAEAAPVAAAPVVQQVSVPNVVEPAEPAAPIELTLEVVETVWVRAVVDGKRLFEETLSRGMVKPIHAQQQVELKVGNAGGVLLSLNGQDLPAIGPRGYVRSLTVTPQGIETIEGEAAPSRPTVDALPQSTAALRWADVAWSRPLR